MAPSSINSSATSESASRTAPSQTHQQTSPQRQETPPILTSNTQQCLARRLLPLASFLSAKTNSNSAPCYEDLSKPRPVRTDRTNTTSQAGTMRPAPALSAQRPLDFRWRTEPPLSGYGNRSWPALRRGLRVGLEMHGSAVVAILSVDSVGVEYLVPASCPGCALFGGATYAFPSTHQARSARMRGCWPQGSRWALQ